MSKNTLISLILAFFILVGYANASYISMNVKLTPPTLIVEDTFLLNLSVLNSGDEQAHDVQYTLTLPDGFTTEPYYYGNLDPNQLDTHSFNIKIDESVKPGTYALVLKTHYSDANAYPFTTITSILVRYKTSTPPKIRASIDAINLDPSGQEKDLKLQVSNIDAKAHKIYVKFHFPDEIQPTFDSETLELSARDMGEVTVPIKSFGALSGSTYIIFATMWFEDDALHYGSTTGGVVKIISAGEEKEAEKISWIPAAALLILISALILYQVRK